MKGPYRVGASVGWRRLAFLGADFPFHFAHRIFIAFEIRSRAAVLMGRTGRPVADAAFARWPRR
jgi:hypothetical protein